MNDQNFKYLSMLVKQKRNQDLNLYTEKLKTLKYREKIMVIGDRKAAFEVQRKNQRNSTRI